MLRLILMRHAKSSWKSAAKTDHARPLNKRGKRDAPRVAAELVRLGWRPELVLSSDSTRTRETFEQMEPKLDAKPDVRFLSSLYHAGVGEVQAALSTVADNVSCVLVLGHNPYLEEALEWLSGREEVLKTACAALLETNAQSWAEAARQQSGWRLVRMIRPRELASS